MTTHHQQPEQSNQSSTWEDEFEEEFVDSDFDESLWDCIKTKEMKSFIQTQIEKAKEEGRVEALGEVKTIFGMNVIELDTLEDGELALASKTESGISFVKVNLNKGTISTAQFSFERLSKILKSKQHEV